MEKMSNKRGVCVCVCLCLCMFAFRHVSLWREKLKKRDLLRETSSCILVVSLN